MIRRALSPATLLAALMLLVVGCKCGNQNVVDGGTPDAGDAGDAGVRECSFNADCVDDPLRPVCDAAVGQCVGCTEDVQCGAARVCDTDGSCQSAPVPCATDADCIVALDRPVCDLINALCVQCTSNNQCPGLGQICDPTTNTCVTPSSCANDLDCTDPASPRCDLGSGTCVGCLADADCDTAARQTCDTANKICLDFVPCTQDIDCAGNPAGPNCSLVTGDCVLCVDDPDCLSGTGRTCDTTAYTCTGGNRCLDDGGCAGLTRPVCDRALGFCVECAGGADCTVVGSTCDLQARACRAPQVCTTAADCTDPATPLCDTGIGFCVECTADADCTGVGATCLGGICDSGPPTDGRPGAPCTASVDCANSTTTGGFTDCALPDDPFFIPWKWFGGMCYSYCSAESDCPAGSTCLGADPTPNATGICFDLCEFDSDCRAGYGCTSLRAGVEIAEVCAPQCDDSLIDQIPCTLDTDCPLGLCDVSSGMCACSPIGGPCEGPGNCEGDVACLADTDPITGEPTEWVGGYCILFDCDPPAVPCPAGSSCYNVGTTNACLPDCDPNILGSCNRAEYACIEVDRYVIAGACDLDLDCPATVPDCFGAAPGVPGTCIRTCAADADCDQTQGHICRDLQGTVQLCADPFQGGACFAGCANDGECGACTVDADCAAGQICNAGDCRTACTTDPECGVVGQVCVGGLCTAGCTLSAQCPRGAECLGGGCEHLSRRCDGVARRCDGPCSGDLDCDRSRACDTGTGRCFTACADPADDCGPTGQCDATAGQCLVDCRTVGGVCAANDYCDDDTGDCLERCGSFGAGTCTAPEVCDQVTGACVEACSSYLGTACAIGNDCATDEWCWDNTCAPECSIDSDCGPGTTCYFGFVCWPCPSARNICDASLDFCVDCVDDNDCFGARYYCDTVITWDCVEYCGGVNGGNRTCPAGEVCDVEGGGFCETPCASDVDCTKAPRVTCDTSSGLCGECLGDVDCSASPNGPVCDPSRLSCVECLADLDCQNPSPACDTALRVCVECIDDTHCSAPTPACETTGMQCVECLGDVNCPSTRPTCDTGTNLCLNCTADVDCAAPDVCHLDVSGGECLLECGDVPDAPTSETNSLSLAATTTFDDQAGVTANFLPFRGSNDDWAYSPVLADAAPNTATADLVAFALNVPAGATITGFAVDVEASTDGDPAPGADQWVLEVNLFKADATQSTLFTDATALTDADTVRGFGGATQLWGLTWTDVEVNDVGFGVRVSVNETAGAADIRARVDQVLLTVHYTTLGGTDCTLVGGGLTCNATSNRCE